MKRSLAILLQAVIVLVGLATVAFLLWEPQVEGVNANATNFEIYFTDPFLTYAYIASLPFFVVLFQAFKLAGYASENKLKSPTAVKALRIIKRCGLALIVFALGGELFIMLGSGEDDRAGGIAMGMMVILGSAAIAGVASVFERKLQK